jgi:hypothetical protein
MKVILGLVDSGREEELEMPEAPQLHDRIYDVVGRAVVVVVKRDWFSMGRWAIKVWVQ